jgi:hypothetical protein
LWREQQNGRFAKVLMVAVKKLVADQRLFLALPEWEWGEFAVNHRGVKTILPIKIA